VRLVNRAALTTSRARAAKRAALESAAARAERAGFHSTAARLRAQARAVSL